MLSNLAERAPLSITTQPAAPGLAPPPVAKRPTAPKLLQKPEVMQARCEYTACGSNASDFLSMMEDDIILIYAYKTDRDWAIGYNTRTKRGGRFLISAVRKLEPQPEECKVVVCTSCHEAPPTIWAPAMLPWQMNDYVRICADEGSSPGLSYGINLRTLETGDINVSGWPEVSGFPGRPDY